MKELHSLEQVQSWAKLRMMDWALSGLQLVFWGVISGVEGTQEYTSLAKETPMEEHLANLSGRKNTILTAGTPRQGRHDVQFSPKSAARRLLARTFDTEARCAVCHASVHIRPRGGIRQEAPGGVGVGGCLMAVTSGRDTLVLSPSWIRNSSGANRSQLDATVGRTDKRSVGIDQLSIWGGGGGGWGGSIISRLNNLTRWLKEVVKALRGHVLSV